MADLDDIYSNRILELASQISHTERLDEADASASAHSKLCGSKIDVDIKIDEGRITDFGQDVKACLLGQAAASIVGREIVGTAPEELHKIAREMDDMLKNGGPAPTGRWSDLAILEPVKDYPHRHASTMLVFTAIEDALQQIEARQTA